MSSAAGGGAIDLRHGRGRARAHQNRQSHAAADHSRSPGVPAATQGAGDTVHGSRGRAARSECQCREPNPRRSRSNFGSTYLAAGASRGAPPWAVEHHPQPGRPADRERASRRACVACPRLDHNLLGSGTQPWVGYAFQRIRLAFTTRKHTRNRRGVDGGAPGAGRCTHAALVGGQSHSSWACPSRKYILLMSCPTTSV